MTSSRASRLLITAAAAVIVIAGLKALARMARSDSETP
jgi:hypothetical protein